MEFNLEEDIFYDKDYVGLYMGDEDKIFEFAYLEGDKYLKNIAIKRPIKRILNTSVEDGFYDLETAYGYGGMYTNTDDKQFLKRALEKYKEKCISEGIIAEFVRFHPFNEIHKNISDYFNFLSIDRKVVYVDLTKGYDEINEIYGSSLRRDLRKPYEYGVLFKESEKIEESRFTELYYATMKKVNASKFYFFSDEYFSKLSEMPSCKIYGAYYEGKFVTSVIILESFPIIYYHLAATDPDCYPLNVNSFNLDQIIKLYTNKGFQCFYLGGGIKQGPDDSLFKFKYKFSKLTTDFVLGGKIYNESIYNRYVEIFKNEYPDDINYFLKYRFIP